MNRRKIKILSLLLAATTICSLAGCKKGELPPPASEGDISPEISITESENQPEVQLEDYQEAYQNLFGELPKDPTEIKAHTLDFSPAENMIEYKLYEAYDPEKSVSVLVPDPELWESLRYEMNPAQINGYMYGFGDSSTTYLFNTDNSRDGDDFDHINYEIHKEVNLNGLLADVESKVNITLDTGVFSEEDFIESAVGDMEYNYSNPNRNKGTELYYKGILGSSYMGSVVENKQDGFEDELDYSRSVSISLYMKDINAILNINVISSAISYNSFEEPQLLVSTKEQIEPMLTELEEMVFGFYGLESELSEIKTSGVDLKA